MTPQAKKAYEAWRKWRVTQYSQTEFDVENKARREHGGTAIDGRAAMAYVAGWLACHRATRRTGEKKAKGKR